jgi:hypothetical protein
MILVITSKRRTATMSTLNLDRLYEQQIKPLPRVIRLQLLARIAQDLAAADEEQTGRSIMELHGLGAEIWRDIDAQQYVNRLRDEWERP